MIIDDRGDYCGMGGKDVMVFINRGARLTCGIIVTQHCNYFAVAFRSRAWVINLVDYFDSIDSIRLSFFDMNPLYRGCKAFHWTDTSNFNISAVLASFLYRYSSFAQDCFPHCYNPFHCSKTRIFLYDHYIPFLSSIRLHEAIDFVQILTMIGFILLKCFYYIIHVEVSMHFQGYIEQRKKTLLLKYQIAITLWKGHLLEGGCDCHYTSDYRHRNWGYTFP